jgi:hypothetical protein
MGTKMTAIILQFPVPPKFTAMEEAIELVLDVAHARGDFRADLKHELNKTYEVFVDAEKRTIETLPGVDSFVWESLTDAQRTALAQWASAVMLHIHKGVALPALARMAIATHSVVNLKSQVRAMGFKFAE